MLIVSNWKAYVENPAKAKALVAAAKRLVARGGADIVLAPSSPFLGMFATDKGNKKLLFAAQDLSDSTGGAATGEITAAMLSGLGVSYVILGHSERRAMGEDDALIVSKVQHALAHGLIPIVCVGERERDADANYLQFLRAQINSIFSPLTPKERIKVVLAYEPIWAIGKSAAESITPHELHEMVLYIRKVLGDFFPGTSAQKVTILYGGSVEPGNIRDLAGGSQVDGFLIGHASVEVSSFTALVKGVA
jgi:triosephosphate isomerase (TIM)